jgi:hypothetical protein
MIVGWEGERLQAGNKRKEARCRRQEVGNWKAESGR